MNEQEQLPAEQCVACDTSLESDKSIMDVFCASCFISTPLYVLQRLKLRDFEARTNAETIKNMCEAQHDAGLERRHYDWG
jgi:hypothetical protein